jgi:CBS domain-containing protein
LSRINAHEIKSLPVVNKDKIVVGLIDIIDIAAIIGESLNHDDEQTDEVTNQIMTMTIGSVLTQAKRKPFIASNRLSLMHAIECLVSTNQERFVIVDREVTGFVEEQSQSEEFLDGICTQADAVRFLSQNTVLLMQEPLFQKTLSDLNLGKRLPLILSHRLNSYKAFMEMVTHGSDSAAVVDDSGKLLATISVSDLKGLTRRNCGILREPLYQFLKRDWSRGWWNRPITVSLSDPLYFVVLQFVSSKVHRMYIVDEEQKPIGDVNLLDALYILTQID